MMALPSDIHQQHYSQEQIIEWFKLKKEVLKSQQKVQQFKQYRDQFVENQNQN